MIFRHLVLNSLKSMSYGSLTVRLPDGSRRTFGGLDPRLRARLTISEENFFRR